MTSVTGTLGERNSSEDDSTKPVRVINKNEVMFLYLCLKREGVPKYRNDCVLHTTGHSDLFPCRVYYFDLVNKKILESRKGEFGAFWKFADIKGGSKLGEHLVEMQLTKDERYK